MLPTPLAILDGATGTELQRRGLAIPPPLWSARAIEEAPDVLREIHADFLNAGADAITACTFRTSRRTLAKAGRDGDDARTLTQRAVEIAREARDATNTHALVLGSVAPLEECYRPDLAPSASTCADEHGMMIETLLAAGADGILIEAMSTQHEAIAAARAAEQLALGRWIISFVLKSDGPPGILLSGEPLADILPGLGGAIAIGINCVAAPAMTRELTMLHALVPKPMRLIAYANTGRRDDEQRWHDTDATEPQRYAQYAEQWRDAGASMIGGCCGTTPEHVRALVARLRPPAPAR